MAIKTDERYLLLAVAADPGNDLPRLVYADWLDDHDRCPHQAELIRLECGLAVGSVAASALPAAYGRREELRRSVAARFGGYSYRTEFDRGLVNNLHLNDATGVALSHGLVVPGSINLRRAVLDRPLPSGLYVGRDLDLT